MKGSGSVQIMTHPVLDRRPKNIGTDPTDPDPKHWRQLLRNNLLGTPCTPLPPPPPTTPINVVSVKGSVADPDRHHFGKLDQDPHQRGKLGPDQDPHQSEKQARDPHRSEKVEALEGHYRHLRVQI
jgi:hypothetical protein